MWVSAINNQTFEFTVGLSEEVETLGAATLKLGNVTATAALTSIDGKTAKYTVNNADVSKLVTGNYVVTIEGVTNAASHTANYEKFVTTTSILGVVVADDTVSGEFDADLEEEGLAGVAVKVGNKTATTNAFGYYQIPDLTAGLLEVEYRKDGYFVKREDVITTRNEATSQPVELVEREATLYEIEGTLLDNATSTAAAGVTVTLQQKVNGEWADVINPASPTGEAFEAETSLTGKYGFANAGAYIVGNAAFETNVGTALKYSEAEPVEYRVVANNPISEINFKDVYVDQVSAPFKLSDEAAVTTNLTKITKVKEIKDFNFNVKWDTKANKDATDLTVSLINTDGEKILVGEELDATPVTNPGTLTAAHVAGEATLKDDKAINLVEKNFFGAGVNPRIPVGNYFLKVDDGEADNSVAYVAVKVTEEGQVITSTDAVITEAATINANAAVASLSYADVLTGATTDTAINTHDGTTFGAGASAIEANINAYLTIGDAKVLVAKEVDQGFNYDATLKLISSSPTPLDNLPAGNYTVSAAGEFVAEGTKTFALAKGGAIVSPVDVTALGQITVPVEDADGITGDITPKLTKLEVIDVATGKVVETTNATFNNTGGIATVADNVITGLKPGEYKVKVSAAGYKAGESEEFTVKDFYEIDIPKIELVAGDANPVVTGYALFNDNTAADGAVVTAYDENGKYVGVDTVANGKYEFIGLKKGAKYSLVIREEGKLETQKQNVVVPTEDGTTKVVDFDVVKGGQGKYEVIIVDEKNVPVTFTAAQNVYLQDEFSALDLSAITSSDNATQVETKTKAALDLAVTTTDHDGILGLNKNPNNQSVATNLFTTGTPNLSAGAHKVVISTGTTTKSYDTTVTVTKNATIDGGIIKLQLKGSADGTLTYNVAGKVITDPAISAANTGYVLALAKDANGAESVVNSSSIAADGKYSIVLPGENSKYRLVTVLNGKYTGSKDVTVQDRDLTDQDITVKATNR